MLLIPSIRGMRDLLPAAADRWHEAERVSAACFRRYGYGEIRTPILERAELFRRQLGEDSDIVQKEMYEFTDVNGDCLTLRPEATVSVVRALAQSGMRRGELARVWYGGPMFRRERPQKGRYRQFWQLGVEALGAADAALDAEQIIMLSSLWEEWGIKDKLSLTINNLGLPDERARHRQKLRDYFRQHAAALEESARARIDGNPLRILDSKDAKTREIAAAAPRLSEELGEESRAHVEAVKNMLEAVGIEFMADATLVRGLDYYNLTVFEWTVRGDERRQNVLCGGGRYDGLAEQIGAPLLPGCGFALGLDRLMPLLSEAPPPPPLCYLAVVGGSASYCTVAAENLRRAGVSVWRHAGGGNLARQLKKADAMRTPLVAMVGGDEEADKTVTLRRLEDGEQQKVPLATVGVTAARLIGLESDNTLS